MSATATGAAPGATAARGAWGRPVVWLVVAVLAAAAAAWGLAPPLFVLGPLVVGVVLALLGSTLPLLWIIVVTSGLGFGWLNEVALVVAGNPINLTGLRWGLVILACVAILLREGLPPIPRYLHGYIAFIGFSTIAILWTSSFFEGLKHVLQFTAPLLVALVAMRTLRDRGDEDVLLRAFWIGFALAAVVGVTLGAIGLGGGQPIDEGRPIHRTTGPYLLPLMALALAAWRYRGGRFALFPAVVFLLGVLTLSRATVLVMLGMILLSTWGKPIRWYVGGVLAIILLTVAAFQFEPFRDRFLPEEARSRGSVPAIGIEGEGTDAQLVVAGVPMSGRGLIWLRTLRHAVEAPVLGHGTGSSVQYLTGEVALGIDHPHNDYLRVFHDGGVVGLLVFLVAVWMILRHLLRLHAARGSPRAGERALAAGLAFAGYLGILVFDNGMLFPAWLTQNVFLLLVLADRAARAGIAEGRA